MAKISTENANFDDISSKTSNEKSYVREVNKWLKSNIYKEQVHEKRIDEPRLADTGNFDGNINPAWTKSCKKPEKVKSARDETEHEMGQCQNVLPYGKLNHRSIPESPGTCQSSVENQSIIFLYGAKANFEAATFPRYEYHLNLTGTIFERSHEGNLNSNFNEIFNSLLSIIFVCGKTTSINKELLHPLELQQLLHPLKLEEKNGHEQHEHNVIMVYFANDIDKEHENFFCTQGPMTDCRWTIFVSSNPDKLRDAFANTSKCSFVPPDSDVVWNHLTSALELSLIDYLKKEMESSADEDIEIVLRRIEKCSAFPEIKNLHRVHYIPPGVEEILKRFGRDIVRYGFHFKSFRIVVKKEKYEEVRLALKQIHPTDFPEINVISQDNFKENVVPYNGKLQAQGMKIHQLPKKPEKGKDVYGTLGSLARLNKTDTIALSSKHVCTGCKNDTDHVKGAKDTNDVFVYIEKDHDQRIRLGRCLYTPSGDPAYYNDMAIIEFDEKLSHLFPDKRLINIKGKPKKAEIMDLEHLDITDEIVHKFGAATQLTNGVVVCSELIDNKYHFIGVKGMNKIEFAKQGDSGSLVFIQSHDTKEENIKVVALLYGGDSDTMNDEKNPTPLIYCSGFKKTFEMIKKRYNHVKSISFFND